MRRLAAGLALVVAGAIPGACGSSSHTASTTSSHTATIPAARSFTNTQARAFAHAVNLRPADVRGLQASAKKHERETTAEAALGQEFKHCIGPLASVHALFEAGSDDFHRETRTSAEALPSTEYASSNVEVVRTPSVAAAEAATARSEHVRSCLSRLFGALLSTRVRKEGASVSSLTVSSLTPAAPGASGSYGWKTDITVSAHGIAFATRIDILGFAYGPGLVTLADAGAPQPFPPAREQQLFSVLIGRAEGFSA